MTKAPPRHSLNALLIMLDLVGILLILQAVVRYTDFISNQQVLMANEVDVGSREIEKLIDDCIQSAICIYQFRA